MLLKKNKNKFKVFQNNIFTWCRFEANNYTKVWLINHNEYKSYHFIKNNIIIFKNKEEYIKSISNVKLIEVLNSCGFQMFVENVIHDTGIFDHITKKELSNCFKKAFSE
jgi:hypothetical protein